MVQNKKKVSYMKYPSMKEIKIKYSRKFEENICNYLSQSFPNLSKLSLISCPIGISDCEKLGNKYLPNLIELDMSGDSYLSKESLNILSLNLPALKVFHLGHFEHSDYSC